MAGPPNLANESRRREILACHLAGHFRWPVDSWTAIDDMEYNMTGYLGSDTAAIRAMVAIDSNLAKCNSVLLLLPNMETVSAYIYT